MRIAIISVTAKGAARAGELAQALQCGTENHDIDQYAKTGRNPTGAAEYEHLGKLAGIIFNQYDALIFIMATGIVVRVIAPHVLDKRYDPAVVVMDDAGEHAISLLSGHLGGANELTRKVAAAMGAHPVITTATDVNQKPAADILAVKLDTALEPFDQLKLINAAIVNGDRVGFFLDHSLPNPTYYMNTAEEIGVQFLPMQLLSQAEQYDMAVVVSDKDLYVVKPCLFLRPATLVVGLGCRRGTAGAEILNAVADACKKIGRSMKSIAMLATTVAKEDEIGILAAAQQIEIPVEFYSNEELQECISRHQLKVSGFVEDKIGVGNVCEAAALLAGRTSRLLLDRTVYPNITVAITEVVSQ
ncbi:cobalt-precorrin 5A hydrolase [Acetonema longum]|uniref:Cobalamin (Vitamin B12) biosynthesis CbiG protein n=1 Tax=Acetonema longum DSM 6540 TaxID=1009370 RepID=F7NPX1_9FIRM|nr:cobalt-precorrin 5A hydrolase [Acetonema longum]EGO61962.1 cobalamin (vitamin B12) biosynthesis CbiG protein [Acetonema longum DSM 6540]